CGPRSASRGERRRDSHRVRGDCKREDRPARRGLRGRRARAAHPGPRAAARRLAPRGGAMKPRSVWTDPIVLAGVAAFVGIVALVLRKPGGSGTPVSFTTGDIR